MLRTEVRSINASRFGTPFFDNSILKSVHRKVRLRKVVQFSTSCIVVVLVDG